MRYTSKTATLVSIIFVLWACASIQAVNLPKTDKLIPPETIILLDIDNFSQLKGQFEKTNLYELYKDPAMEAFFRNAKTKWLEKTQKLDENNIIKTLFEADVLPEGRLAVALVLNEQTKDANEPPFLFITQWGQNISKIKEAIAKMVEKNAEIGGHSKRSESFQAVTIETAIDENGTTFSYSFIDDCFIGSTNLEILKFTIAHIKGASSPTLASDNDYSNTIKTTGPNHDMDLYINIKQMAKIAASKDTTGQVQTTIAALGIDNVPGLGCSMGFARTAGSSYSGKALLKINGSKKGICRMLEPESAGFRVPKFISASACRLSFLNLDIKNAHAELANILSGFNPMLASMLYVPLVPPGPQGEPGLQLKADIIDHLGSQIVIAQSIKKPFTSSPMPAEYIVAFSVNNRGALEKSMSRLHNEKIAPNNPDAKRELLGHTIYLVSLKSLPFFSTPGRQPMQGPGAASTPAISIPTLAFTITDTHLIFGTDSTVEKAIRTLNSGNSISSAGWFNTAKSAVPDIAGMAGFEDNKAAAEFFWWMMKENPKTIELANPMVPNPAVFFSQMGLDFSLLPEFNTVSKYFGLSVSYLISRADGFFMEFRDVNPTSR